MELLFISNLFPDTSEPNRGLVNARMLRALVRETGWPVRVLALRPVPLSWGAAAKRTLRSLPEDVCLQPQYVPVPYLPKIGDRVNPGWYASVLRQAIGAMPERRPDVLLGAWMYPDVCGLVRAQTGLPVVGIAQGTDVHQYLSRSSRRAQILSAARSCARVICRSRDLAAQLTAAGLPEERSQVIYNGVETDVFCPGDRAAARAKLGWSADTRVVLFVGNLLPVKNPEMLLEAFVRLVSAEPQKSHRLVLVGEGPLDAMLEQRVTELRLGEQVQFAGRKAPAELADYYRAADVLAVPSLNEGVPNVVLEAFACGLPVVATRVGGIPEVLVSGTHGQLVKPDDVSAMVAGLQAVLQQPPPAETLLAHAHTFSWVETARRYRALLEESARSR